MMRKTEESEKKGVISSVSLQRHYAQKDIIVSLVGRLEACIAFVIILRSWFHLPLQKVQAAMKRFSTSQGKPTLYSVVIRIQISNINISLEQPWIKAWERPKMKMDR